ncbi:MAG: right-handed parallel beta-helix repeat-containing protein [Clostridia bacterium]|nr:right-handed parallel beta-helix repeat-containing protein [Clostridia bacterium]
MTINEFHIKLNPVLPETADRSSDETAVLTRETAADILAHRADICRVLLPFKKEIDKEYTDIEDVSSRCRFGVDFCAMTGLFPTFPDGSFRPKEPLTETEADEIVSVLRKITEEGTHAREIITCHDMIDSPRSVYSNMTSSVRNDGSLSVMRFTPYPTHTAPWYMGLDHAAGDVSDSAMKYCKICIRAEKQISPYLVLSSPVFSGTVYPCSVEEQSGFTAYLFPIEDTFRSLRHACLTAENPYADSTDLPLRRMHLKKLNSRYLRLAFYPFGEETDVSADILYFGFFADREEAEQYTAAADAARYAVTEDTVRHPQYQPVTEEIIAENNAAIERRVREIQNTPNVLTPDQIRGTCYYISSAHGDDSNDGLSPETAWKSITKLILPKEGEWFSTPLTSYPAMEHVVKRGDGVFLERGSVFNAELVTGHAGDYTMWFADGVSYGAYGEGEKPVITCCVDYNGSRNWVKTEYEHVWMLDETLEIPSFTTQLSYNDIANIVVRSRDGITGHGIKVLAANPEDPFNGQKTVPFGMISNGFEIYESGGIPFTSPGCLRNNLEYIHDWKSARVYLYCDKGNPGEVYESVILTRQGIGAYGGSDCLVDNLAFRYIGTFGISTHNIKNLTIQNCTFEWTGGAIQEKGTTIFGGGIQNWCSCDGFYIRNCYSNQALDAAFSTQGVNDDTAIMHDVVVENCVAINANSSVEIWNYSPKVRLVANVRIRDNLFGYVGYHFGNRKIITAKDACILQFGIGAGQDPENVVFERNLCMFASSACFWARPILCRGDTTGTFLRDNTYILSSRKAYMLTSPDLRNDHADEDRWCVLFTERMLREFTELGIDRNSRFYFVDGYAFDGEADGVYIPPYFVEKQKYRISE